jgi:hypothetical protein
MDSELKKKVNIAIGMFVLSCLVCTIFFGWQSIIACIIGLSVIAAILQIFRGGPGSKSQHVAKPQKNRLKEH